MTEHRIRFVQRLHAPFQTRRMYCNGLRNEFDVPFCLRHELVQRPIQQAHRDWQAIHFLENSLKVRLLHG